MAQILEELRDARRRLALELVVSNRMGDGWAQWTARRLAEMDTEIRRMERERAKPKLYPIENEAREIVQVTIPED